MRVDEIHFVWDDKKAARNRLKHGIGFEEAKTVFYDEYARLIPDPDHSLEEERFLLLGVSTALRVLVVCHCYRSNDCEIRLISARKATLHEQHQYRELRK